MSSRLPLHQTVGLGKYWILLDGLQVEGGSGGPATGWVYAENAVQVKVKKNVN